MKSNNNGNNNTLDSGIMKIQEPGNVTPVHDSKDSWRLEQMKCPKFLNCVMAVAECAYSVTIPRWTLAESVHVGDTDIAKL
jgi:hypothetical protein